MNWLNRGIMILMFIGFSAIGAWSQNITTASDTISVSDTTKKSNTFFTLFRGKPGRAALYSLVIPGGGQAYNKKWWKVPLAIGIDGVAYYNVYFNQTLYKKYDNIYKTLAGGGSHPDFFSASDVAPLRSAYRQKYEYAWLYFGIAHLVTVFDAFVDRHLIEFDISQDLSLGPPELQTVPVSNIISVSIPLSSFSFTK